MNFFVGVIFFCIPGECAFWKSEELFDTRAKCEAVIGKSLDIFEKHADVASGACLQIRMSRT